jgi:hypothetical protein
VTDNSAEVTQSGFFKRAQWRTSNCDGHPASFAEMQVVLFV